MAGRSVHHRRLPLVLPADALFRRLLGDAPDAFWLDSSLVADGLSRFSFMGRLGPALPPPGRDADQWLDGVRQALAACRARDDALPFDFIGGYVGSLGYELRPDPLPAAPHPPGARLCFVDRFLAVDHLTDSLYLVGLETDATGDAFAGWADAVMARLINPSPPPQPAMAEEPVVFTLRHDRAAYHALIEKALDHIAAGDSYELCLTNRIHTPARVDPLHLYELLRRRNPAPWGAFLRMGAVAIASASPESFLRVTRDGRVRAKPIKGTIARGATPDEDRALAEHLGASDKDRAENLMIVDLLRNDLARVSVPGSVHVPALMAIESYATVHQLVSTVEGRLAPGRDALDAVAAAFPGGSMTGAPKARSLAILDALEGGPRGIYSGAIGYLSANGCADLNIVIRTVVQDADGLTIGVGGAIVAQSDAPAEFAETLLKGRAAMAAIAEAVTGDPDRWTLAGVD